MEGMEIRPATLDDEAEWRRLWTAYLDFYETKVPEEVYAETWKRLHTEGEYEPRCLLAVTHTKPMGLVHFLYHRTTWSLVNNCYLQDLYVDPERRGTGLGQVLIEAVQRIAGEKGIKNVYWMTHETNATARKLYDRVARRTGFIEYDLL
ncbi:GNAT family N-acetyltransferase [Tianweitania sediminis]|uniref:GNAT family N-acetyltransferase n=1 Tax=Tianweitania sediminis TaxID=1502156 RepID=A0A8J7UIW5_9HYPH|nr:GNAT family N-acetyltransferase [Tianweitania sediminis]MBP0438074.1 GNAT family N-acetyltransferase [Tianweitania sediminis]